MIELVPAKLEHVEPIASRMREWDRIEVEALGQSPAAALRMGLLASVDCYTAMVDGRPEAMLGLVPKNAMEGEGNPWMLGSNAINASPRGTFILSQRIVAIWRDSLPHLSNLVAAENARTIRYLRRLGFAVGDERVSLGGVDFVKFEML